MQSIFISQILFEIKHNFDKDYEQSSRNHESKLHWLSNEGVILPRGNDSNFRYQLSNVFLLVSFDILVVTACEIR